MMQYTIRKALPHDIEAIIGLCAEHAMYEQAEYQTAGKAERLSVMLFGEQPRLHCLIVELAYEMIGYATFSQECSTWCADYYIHLDCLYLKEAYRGFGIGEALVKQVEIYAKEANASHVEWQTPIFNERAIKFYHRLGATAKEKLRFTLQPPSKMEGGEIAPLQNGEGLGRG